MADELGSETREEMRSLCKKISVAHKLDSDIQEELYAHMEDKLIAYLDGEEQLAEKDAFILVREHFGKASVVKGLMQDAHRQEAYVSLWRRFGAALIATMSVTVVGSYSANVLVWLWPTTGGFIFLESIAVLSVIIPWMLLWRWQRGLDSGHTPWFITRRPMHFLAWVAALLVLQALVPLTHSNNIFLPPTAPAPWRQAVWWLTAAILYASPILHCMMWLWWSDRPPRKAWAVLNTAILWIMWSCFSVSLIITFNMIIVIPPRALTTIPSIAQILETQYLRVLMWTLAAFALYRMPKYARIGHRL